MAIWVQTSKYGDILSVLPMIHHDYQTTGKKPDLVVCRPYDQLVAGLDYVTPRIFDGDMHDLAGAIKFGKTFGRDVRVTQMHGRGFKFEHRHPSFQYDQWDRGGMLNQWDKLPLVLPRRPDNVWRPNPKYLSPDGKEQVSYLDQRIIVYADHSQSSPFPHKEELAKLLIENFPKHQVVRLSSVRAPHLLDVLALMDASDLIVSVDTVHLHLSKACSKPVIALVCDRPERWFGSAWSSRFIMHCRYRSFPLRKDELVRTAKSAMLNEDKPVVKSGNPSNPNGYNLSMIWHGESLITTHRYHPVKDGWQTRLAINDGVLTSDIIFPSDFDGYSCEDARLFHHNGKLMISYVLSIGVAGTFRCIVGYGMLVQREGRWRIDRHIQPAFRDNDLSATVKNWCPFEHDGNIHFIWGVDGEDQIVIRVDGNKVVEEMKSPAPRWDFGVIRGGAITSYDGKLIRFFHSRSGGSLGGPHGSFRYHIGAALMEAKPPFKTISVTPHPIISGDERYVTNCFHWKPDVAIPYGVVSKSSNGLVELSIGRNDCQCEAIVINPKKLKL